MDEPRVARSWIEFGRKSLESRAFVQKDFDELTGQPVPRDVVAVSIRLFGRIVEEVSRIGFSMEPLLVIPLMDSTSLDTSAPDLEALVAADWTGDISSPPGFYLSTAGNWDDWGDFEFYRKPVAPLLNQPGLRFFYNVQRTIEEAALGWEYSRTFIARPDSPQQP